METSKHGKFAYNLPKRVRVDRLNARNQGSLRLTRFWTGTHRADGNVKSKRTPGDGQLIVRQRQATSPSCKRLKYRHTCSPFLYGVCCCGRPWQTTNLCRILRSHIKYNNEKQDLKRIRYCYSNCFFCAFPDSRPR